MLIMKDPEKGTAGNYRPITCLPVMWQLLTGIISERLCEFLDVENVLHDEQKGCRRNCRGTNDQLYIDKVILKESKARTKNLAMGLIDYKKAYDMIPPLDSGISRVICRSPKCQDPGGKVSVG